MYLLAVGICTDAQLMPLEAGAGASARHVIGATSVAVCGHGRTSRSCCAGCPRRFRSTISPNLLKIEKAAGVRRGIQPRDDWPRLHVTAAPADQAVESRLHLRWGGMRMPIEQRLCREHPALQAVAALERLFRNEACCTGCGCSAVPRLLALSPVASPYTQGNLYEGL